MGGFGAVSEGGVRWIKIFFFLGGVMLWGRIFELFNVYLCFAFFFFSFFFLKRENAGKFVVFQDPFVIPI